MNATDQAVHTVQFLSVDAVEKANSGHPGTPMALATITVELFAEHLRYHPEDPAWPNRDRFVLSCGHASMLLYSILHLAGYDLPKDELVNFRQWGSKTPGHPEYGHTPGVEMTTGPLGQGISTAVGMALASKHLAARLNTAADDLIDYRVFVIASDGDLMEGVAAEASSLAGHWKLDNLIVVYDDNKITIDGSTEKSFTEDVAARYAAYGWDVLNVDGHDALEVRDALTTAARRNGKPTLIIARTHIGIGAPTKQDTAAAHGAPLGAKEVAGAKQNAGWPAEPTFHIPKDAASVFAAQRGRNAERYQAWQARRAAVKDPEATKLLELVAGAPVPDLVDQLLEVAPSEPDATRSTAGAIQQTVASAVPTLIGGSADLAGSCKTTIKAADDLTAQNYAGRNLHFGIREHGMAAVMNGLALSGLVPFGSTFLIFSDYMRPSIRLAALMNQRAVYVFTHDSVFLGEDGPTHQPIEQLWSLRLIPNLDVVRPADAAECAVAWAHAVSRSDGPTALVLSRQKLPALSAAAPGDLMRRGAHVVVDAPDAAYVLIASGSEVHAATEAASLLAEQGHPTRVVSMPCVEAFLKLPRAEQDRLLGAGKRVAIEAGRSLPWCAITGSDGIQIGVDRFGASAPAARLAEEFGLSGARVAARVLEGA